MEGGEEMKAAIYCRVSTEDQEREGTSLISQKEACLKKAQELGYTVSEEFIVMETYSGLSLNRPKLDQLRQWVRDKEVDMLLPTHLTAYPETPSISLSCKRKWSGVESS